MTAQLPRETKGTERTIMSVEELREFFKSCDLRETGREPDWEDHMRTIESSKPTTE